MAALFLMLLVHIFWKQKHKPRRHIPGPGPFSPLMFIIMSAFTFNNTMLLRRLYNKYQRVFIYYQIQPTMIMQTGEKL